jgi:hypothetical protein
LRDSGYPTDKKLHVLQIETQWALFSKKKSHTPLLKRQVPLIKTNNPMQYLLPPNVTRVNIIFSKMNLALRHHAGRQITLPARMKG